MSYPVAKEPVKYVNPQGNTVPVPAVAAVPEEVKYELGKTLSGAAYMCRVGKESVPTGDGAVAGPALFCLTSNYGHDWRSGHRDVASRHGWAHRRAYRVDVDLDGVRQVTSYWGGAVSPAPENLPDRQERRWPD